MGIIKEPKDIDFTNQSEPWTEEELKDFREIMKGLKEQYSKGRLHTSKSKKKVGA
jgi:hypothetical protein